MTIRKTEVLNLFINTESTLLLTNVETPESKTPPSNVGDSHFHVPMSVSFITSRETAYYFKYIENLIESQQTEPKVISPYE